MAMRGRGIGRWLVLGLPLVLAGCVAATGSATTAPSSALKLSIGNWTTIPVTLVVNGAVVETVPAGGYEDPIKGDLPKLPWDVEVRSPSGRVLSSMTVHAGDYWATSMPDGGGAARGDAVRVDLSCGRVDLWYGTPMLGPGYEPSASYAFGDCV
jgi:hypothetical protein